MYFKIIEANGLGSACRESFALRVPLKNRHHVWTKKDAFLT